jgi:hypothetical protein
MFTVDRHGYTVWMRFGVNTLKSSLSLAAAYLLQSVVQGTLFSAALDSPDGNNLCTCSMKSLGMMLCQHIIPNLCFDGSRGDGFTAQDIS